MVAGAKENEKPYNVGGYISQQMKIDYSKIINKLN
jgi:hypothetical protein